jgi:hypothetical protein
MSDWTRYAASRRSVLLGGLATTGFIVVGRPGPAAADSYTEFRCCARCGAAWRAGGGSGSCPAGRLSERGGHLDAAPGYRIAARPATSAGPGRWSWCLTCGLLHLPGAGAGGACANGLCRRHSATAAYLLAAADGWRCCAGCSGLFRPVDGPQWMQCAAGGAHQAAGPARLA